MKLMRNEIMKSEIMINEFMRTEIMTNVTEPLNLLFSNLVYKR